ncbi:class C sortase [Microbacterium sp. A204]|uniref:class C sortase n=1 Tax=Microbacterium sp. A204 TaxID=3457321 RepID=UPI003FD3EB11
MRILHSASRWKPSGLSVIICVLALAGSVVGLYPATAAWLSSYQQSLIVKNSTASLDSLNPGTEEQMRMAHAYNDALVAGVALEAGTTVPSGYAQGVGGFTYRDVLNATDEGVMGRVKIDSIDVDLPIYHGTDQRTLEKGAGHLEGSHLPVGGEGTRTVVTAHRGLASSTLFTNLDQVEVGDRFQLVTLGEVLTYEVREKKVIDPDDTDTLRPQADRDLATLITCTPLGINSHRIVITGERVTPTPIRDVEEARAVPVIPGFPWWAVIGAVLLISIIVYFIRTGFTDAQATRRRRVHTDRMRTTLQTASDRVAENISQKDLGATS